MNHKPTSVNSIYYRDAGSIAGARGTSARARAAMYALFVRELQPTASTTILDVGVSDEEGPETNMLEKQYPWAHRITCAGLGDGRELRRAYPGLSYVKIDGARGLPFRDKAFDIAWSNAVLEHVGGREQRAVFLRELIRVARAVFITVPNRWFPVEHHTGIPFLHWNGALFRASLRHTPLRHWSDARNMDFLSRRMLIDEWPGDGSSTYFMRVFGSVRSARTWRWSREHPSAWPFVSSWKDHDVNDAAHATARMSDEVAPRPALARRNWLLAALFLAGVLIVGFSPAIFGRGTLMHASWDAPSVMNTGAYDSTPRPLARYLRTVDPGASAWQTEAWQKLIANELWGDLTLPLWNPYNGYGAPLSADALSQPFYPLTALLSLHVTPWTYSFYLVARLFVGGVLMYLFAAQFLTMLPSLFAAVTFMLTGYFIIYLNIAHLSVEVLTPGLFLTFELVARKNSWAAVAGAAVMILVANAGGMPESLFLILAFASFYFVCRVLFTPELRARAGALAVKFVVAVVAGFALSGFLLLPFLEFLRIAHDVHQPSNVGGMQGGLGADGDYRTTVQYLLPLIFGPILNSILSNGPAWSGVRGYWGIIPFFFAVLALLVLSSRRRAGGWTAEPFLTIFFAATLVLMILKRFGNVLVNWIGALPLAEMVVFPKYQEPLIAVCVAMLGAIGLAALIERRASRVQVIAAGAIGLALMLGLAASFYPTVRALAVKSAVFFSLTVKVSLFYPASIVCGVALLLVLVALVLYAQRASESLRPRLMAGIVVLLSLELLFNFIIPSFYIFGSLPPLRADPYKGAPYIDFIHAANKDYSRVFARDAVLYPNWSSAFRLADVRNIDAMHFKRFRTFIRSFLLPPEAPPRQNGDLADRFSGDEFPYEFDTDRERRFLALSSIRYLISDSEFGWSPRLVSEILEQHRGENIFGLAAEVFHIGNTTTSTVRGLFQHPPSPRVSYRTVIDPKAPVFEALAVIKKEAFGASDGVGFRLELKDGDRIETLFETLLDPRRIPADRDGRPVRVDLSRYAGREVVLLFSTDPGPKGDASADWAGWARPHFVPPEGAAATIPFKKVYAKEVGVYEVSGVLPRAALYDAIEIQPDGDVLDRLKNPAFDPQRKAIVSRESLAPEQAGAAQALAAAGGAPARAASIVLYKPMHVRVETESAAPALLVLNDTNFPGWHAYVNGEPAAMVSANYLFRGVFVPASKSIVEFRYEPRSFQAGVAISLVAFVTLGGLVFRERRRRRSAANA